MKIVKTGAVKSTQIGPIEKQSSEVAYALALESIVLLKNDGALPIREKRVALYGNGALKTVKGGTGSGEVHSRNEVSVYEGLKNVGLQIGSESWLRDYKKEYDEGEIRFGDALRQKVKHSLFHLDMNEFNEAFAMNYATPCGRPITQQDVADSDTPVCIYVVSRQCGEGMDRNPDSAEFHLKKEELEAISFCANHYEKTVVVLNVGGVMDLTELENITGISAIVYMGMLGCRGGDALAAILSGKVTPSGHLAYTWMKRYDDVPFAREFGPMAADKLVQEYKEGMYVGYRYYDSFHVPVRYPFGYGLSYTEFSTECTGAEIDGTVLNLSIKVTNTGDTYNGKEVVQVYVSEPATKLHKPYQRLAAFAKTKELAPGESQQLNIKTDFRELGSFFEEDHTSRLEAGVYRIRIGNSSQNTQLCAAVTLGQEVVLEKHTHLAEGNQSFRELEAEPLPAIQEAPLMLSLNAADFSTVDHTSDSAYLPLDAASQKVLDSLTLDECIDLVVGDGMDLTGKWHDFICPGAVGYTTSNLVDKGVPLLIFSDGPSGLRIQKTSALCKDKIRPVEAMGDIFNYLPKWIFKLIHADPEKSELVYQYATAFPVGNMAAQSWNLELLEQEGQAFSAEMAAYGINFWLGPGVNIHRNPLNGRNYEYYSEDPYLTGKITAAVTRGVQKRRGTYVTIKHFFCNSQEEQRGFMTANVSERVMREIYLKAFEIAVKEADAIGIMTSYNKVNGVYNCNNPRLLEDVLRKEWGFRGVLVTDWMATAKGAADPALAMKAGQNLLTCGMASDKKGIRKALKQGVITEADVRKCAKDVIRIARNSERPL